MSNPASRKRKQVHEPVDDDVEDDDDMDFDPQELAAVEDLVSSEELKEETKPKINNTVPFASFSFCLHRVLFELIYVFCFVFCVFMQDGLLAKLKEIALPSSFQWVETLQLSTVPVDAKVTDDLQREAQLYVYLSSPFLALVDSFFCFSRALVAVMNEA
jgi:hypothetical protein